MLDILGLILGIPDIIFIYSYQCILNTDKTHLKLQLLEILKY